MDGQCRLSLESDGAERPSPNRETVGLSGQARNAF